MPNRAEWPGEFWTALPSPSFKYADAIKDIKDCPPDTCSSRRTQAFRVVFSDPPNTQSFLPVAMRNPGRRLDPKSLCIAYGLSFFDSIGHLKAKMRILKKNYPRIEATIGSKIAEGVIEQKDGKSNTPNSSGHFTLHEFRECELHKKFTVVADAIT